MAQERLRLGLPLLYQRAIDEIAWGYEGKDARYLSKPRRPLAKRQEAHRKLLLYIAQKMAGTRSRRRRQATNTAGWGLGLTTLRKVTTADEGS